MQRSSRRSHCPKCGQRLVSQGIDPIGNTPAQFAAYVQTEIGKWAKVIKATGVTAE